MIEIEVRKVQGPTGKVGLVPVHLADEVELEKMPFGKAIRVEMRVPRSGPYHRLMMKAFTLIALVLNAGPGQRDWDKDRVRRRLLIHTGHADLEVLPGATKIEYGLAPEIFAVNLEPRSMAFDKMEQREAQAFFEAALIYVLSQFGPWVKGHPAWTEVVNIGAKLRLEPEEARAEVARMAA